MHAIQLFLEQSPVLALFLVIALGYGLGAVRVAGVSFGVGAVLFIGLAIGAMAPKSVPPALVSSLGLIMFLYGIGVQYGQHFVAGLTSRAGLRANLLATTAILVTIGVVLLSVHAFGIRMTVASGLFAGAGTSTSALAAAQDQAVASLAGAIPEAERAALRSEPAIGYSIAYPLGVIVPILIFQLAHLRWKPRFTEQDTGGKLQLAELAVTGQQAGRMLAEISRELPEGVVIAAVRVGSVNQLPRPDLMLTENDTVLVHGSTSAIEAARQRFGKMTAGQIVFDRSTLDYTRIFVSNSAVVGRALSALDLSRYQAMIAHIRRGDAVILPTPDLILEMGDLVGVLSARDQFPALEKFFGGSIKGEAEVNYIPLGLGMVLGVLLGLISIPLPGIGSFKLGLAGGVLIVALFLGWLGRIGSLTWTLPLTANLTLRNFGLTLFLAAVGMNSGAPFVHTFQQSGFSLLILGALMVLALVAVTLLIGHWLLRMPFDELLGIASGVTGNPAILAYADKLAPTDRPAIGYAVIFPSATIIKIVAVQLLIALGL
jgi:putative transport protein